jgi:hypothetical protein
MRLGVVHTGGWGWKITWMWKFETSLGNMTRSILKKEKKMDTKMFSIYLYKLYKLAKIYMLEFLECTNSIKMIIRKN